MTHTAAEIHQALIEAGYPIDVSELTSETYGPSTRIAVETYQHDRLLAEDGVCGPITWASLHNGGVDGRYTCHGWIYKKDDARACVRPVLNAAVRELGRPGAQEYPPGSNRGGRIDIYTHPNEGIPWCAAFAYWCYKYAEGGAPYPRLLSAMKVRDWGEQHGHLVAVDDPGQPGDIFVILRGDGHGHVGLIASVLAPGQYATVEGNARDAVRGLVRTRDSFAALVRPILV